MFLDVSELFYSVQGEGANAGTPMFFVRLQGCKAKHACFASGVICDTEFESGQRMSCQKIVERLNALNTRCAIILFTGGEPLDQLTREHVQFFKREGFLCYVETSGLHDANTLGLDYITLSPKVAEHVILKTWSLDKDNKHCNELRYVRHAGQAIPSDNIKADHYFISPHSDGFTINQQNVKHCIDLVEENPKWRISIQQHKQWNVL